MSTETVQDGRGTSISPKPVRILQHVSKRDFTSSFFESSKHRVFVCNNTHGKAPMFYNNGSMNLASPIRKLYPNHSKLDTST